MEYRHLGKHGLRVSEICLGSWLTYGGATAADTARSCIEQAYSLGINFFDTANVYAAGEAEKIVGQVLQQYPRESYVIATKVYFPMGKGPNDRGLSRKHILEQCDASLKRLGLDYIDLYQAHRYDPTVPLAETLMAFDFLVKQGKILYYGVSEWSAGQLAHASDLARLANLAPLASNQPRYNLLDRAIEPEILPLCQREGIGIINYSPLAQGLLTGKYKPGQPLPDGSRASDPKQNMFLNNGNLEREQLLKVQRLLPIAEQEGLSLSQLALAWCLRQRELSSTIIGASQPLQVRENAGASGVELSATTLQRINEILETTASDRATVRA
ncbi:aldo/keto reductase family protein [Kamptonema cortianum]|uniref:Aldo/keto reductase family protein n=1 Tax=Geitlerinema calcuttense NRMC-F 0142 TaxID=2922238 RepID=A0ABT7LVC3_9CYAN|nr:aldo/keto reductase family protein [Geitlerinema calcuttense]MDK3159711.1 aldo/keto reductase family protein [Kamptonema cortianum]MDL5055990.1 aldo/keto reductase family protein [Geitlerinema calcuttense NRMC-F 0142]